MCPFNNYFINQTPSSPLSLLPLSPSLCTFSMSNPLSITTLELETAAAKKPKHHHHQSLLPGIPDHLSHLCLSLVPPSKLYAVCRSWRRLLYSPSFPPFLSLYALFLPAETHHHLSNSIEFSSFDPISSKWQPLPPPPPDWQLRFLFQHPSFISRKLPVQSVTVAGKLVVVAATNDDFLPALSEPLLFDPISGKWALGPQLANPRRWCATGAFRGAVYVASGIGSHYNTDVARSMEKWDINYHHPQPPRLRRWTWQKMGNLKDGKFSRDAIDAVGWRGKLCMVNVKGDAAKEGIIYDIETDSWEEMPEGMLAGWRGPAAAMEEETIYAVDESKGSLKKYDHVRDAWTEVVENNMLKGAQQVAAAAGRVCVSAADGASIVVVDVVAPPPARLWVVDAPPGFHVLAVHILPRLSHTVRLLHELLDDSQATPELFSRDYSELVELVEDDFVLDFCHLFRETNYIAHNLARYGASCSDMRIWTTDVSSLLISLVNQDY